MEKPKIAWNDNRRRLEIRFDSKPHARTRTMLKDRGFWWDGKTGVWHLAKPVSLVFMRKEPVPLDGFAYALRACSDYLGLTADESARITKQHDFACQQAGEQSMEQACGIA